MSSWRGRYHICIEVGDELFATGERFRTNHQARKYCAWLNGQYAYYLRGTRYVFEHVPRGEQRASKARKDLTGSAVCRNLESVKQSTKQHNNPGTPGETRES